MPRDRIRTRANELVVRLEGDGATPQPAEVHASPHREAETHEHEQHASPADEDDARQDQASEESEPARVHEEENCASPYEHRVSETLGGGLPNDGARGRPRGDDPAE